ncbi:DUF4430 domain-containing protein [Clostridium thermarum]|uniref:DUF4430 domain-containing protein n=1 Tax=Clostridium thermarum TaxID=1716543 RepID=UPI0013D5BF82|nr:DUF4430 domain-containing protein [Clostridium thermarum]
MKKKSILILGMLLICSVLFFLSKGLQKNTVEKLTADNTETQNIESIDMAKVENNEKSLEQNPKEEVKPEEEEEIITPTTEAPKNSTKNTSEKEPQEKSNTTLPPKEDAKKPAETKGPEPVDEKPNFIILDTTTNKTIYNGNIKYDNKRSVYEYTVETLEAANIKKHIKSTGYVAMIDNLFDYPTMPDKAGKADWASCGWIFYINGKKSSIGAKDYVPKGTDIITWKYWKDAIYEK